MKYEIYENETYNLYAITTSKFKSVHMEVIFLSEATKENMTYLSLLSSILTENSKEYPTKKMFERKKMDLYNANVYAVNSRVGGVILTNFVLDFVDPAYTSKDMLEESIKLLFDMILNPNAIEEEFDNNTFERIKKRIKIDIDALKEDPKQSSILEAFSLFGKDDIRGMNVTGDLETLETITPRKLYKYYKKFLEESQRDVYIIGNIDVKAVDKIVRKYAQFKSITSQLDDFFLPPIRSKNVKNEVRAGNITQSQLVQIYSIDGEMDEEINYTIPLFNMLWGSGSLESKLYKALRAENSLCYNVSTFYQKYDRSLVVHTAIDEESHKLALKLINNALTEMTKGQFEDEDLDNAKTILVNSLYMTQDSPNRIVDNYVFKNLVGLPDLEDRVDAIRSITREDMIKAAKKLKKVIVFRLKGDGNHEEDNL